MKRIILHIVLLVSVSIFAQQKKDFALPEGNEQFAQKQFAEAEANYRVSKSINAKRATASYNLGNAIYMQNQASEAKYAYAKAIEVAKDKQQKHAAYHNIGNTFMKEKTYDKAVDAYKNALRNNPKDEETRYNYALAKKMLKENPPKKDDDKKDKNKDKDKDKKNDPKEDKKEDKPKDGEDKKDNQGKPKEDQNQNPQPKPGNVPKDRMQNLLDAVNNEEKKIQDRVNAKKAKGKPVENGKDW